MALPGKVRVLVTSQDTQLELKTSHGRELATLECLRRGAKDAELEQAARMARLDRMLKDET